MRARLCQALRTWLDARGWRETLVARVFVVPDLLEEVLFRAAPPPRLAGPVRAAYALAHLLCARLFFPAARPVFYDPVFPLLAALLGLCCTLLYRRTGSVCTGWWWRRGCCFWAARRRCGQADLLA